MKDFSNKWKEFLKSDEKVVFLVLSRVALGLLFFASLLLPFSKYSIYGIVNRYSLLSMGFFGLIFAALLIASILFYLYFEVMKNNKYTEKLQEAMIAITFVFYMYLLSIFIATAKVASTSVARVGVSFGFFLLPIFGGILAMAILKPNWYLNAKTELVCFVSNEAKKAKQNAKNKNAKPKQEEPSKEEPSVEA